MSQPPPSTSGGDTVSSDPRLGATESSLDTTVLKDLAKTSLIETLNEIQGAKTLVLDPSLAGPLGLITEVSLLKHQAVDKMFWLEPGPLSAPTRHIVWLCRPKRSFMRTIADQIKAHQSDPSSSTSGPHHYTIVFVPRATELCKRVLEEEGVSGDVDIAEYKLEFVPLENDVLSLELDNVAREVFLDGDDTAILHSSMALMTFQRAFGLFPRILGKGDASKRLADLLKKHRTSGQGSYGDLEPSESVDGLILIDRAVDWLTPMCTQLTYEGLLSEHVGIKNSQIEVDAALVSTETRSTSNTSATAGLSAMPKKKKQLLSSQTDRLFGELRDLNFSAVGERLSKTAKRLEEDYEGRHNLKTVKEMKDFVGKIGGLQSEHQGLRLHTGLSELLLPITRSDTFGLALEIQQNLLAGYETTAQLGLIEDLMYQQASYATILRLAILLSTTTGGLKQKALESFKRDFLQVYGYHHLPLLLALERLGLLVKSPAKTWFPQVRKGLRLVLDDVDERKPDDIAFTYSGYAPLSVRLVQCVTQKPAVAGNASEMRDQPTPKAHPIGGWKGFEDVLQSLPGALFDETQRSSEAGGAKTGKVGTKTTVVFFIGGCTHAEISALRWLNTRTAGRRFLIATTNISNGSELVSSLGYPAPADLRRDQS